MRLEFGFGHVVADCSYHSVVVLKVHKRKVVGQMFVMHVVAAKSETVVVMPALGLEVAALWVMVTVMAMERMAVVLAGTGRSQGWFEG